MIPLWLLKTLEKECLVYLKEKNESIHHFLIVEYLVVDFTFHGGETLGPLYASPYRIFNKWSRNLNDEIIFTLSLGHEGTKLWDEDGLIKTIQERIEMWGRTWDIQWSKRSRGRQLIQRVGKHRMFRKTYNCIWFYPL